MYHIAIGLNPHPNNHRASQPITPRGLHGLLFNVLQTADPQSATWLHHHRAPKPFSMLAYYDLDNQLAGLRYGALTVHCAEVFATAWQLAYQTGRVLELGRDRMYRIHTVEVIPSDDFATLARRNLPTNGRRQTLNFLSPTDFKQGPGSLPLPLPGNVFGSPFRLWQEYAPRPLPAGWLDWCKEQVFVIEHDIHTVTVPLNLQSSFTGFVGTVTFEAAGGSDEYLRIWHALGTLATFCGIGRKTTMGMGAVEKVTPEEQ